MPSGKQREQEIIKEFVAISRMKISVIDDTIEAPDALLDIDGEKVGIELIEFFLGEYCNRGSIQKQREIQIEVIKSTLGSIDTGEFGAFITLSFSDELPRNDEIMKLVQEIIQYVITADRMEHSTDLVTLYGYQLAEGSLMRRYLSSIEIRLLQNSSQITWYLPYPQNIDVSSDFRDKLQDKIDKLPNYMSHLPSCDIHLLIHADDDSDSTLAPDEEDLHGSLDDWAEKSGFDTVWFFARQYKQLFRIYPSD